MTTKVPEVIEVGPTRYRHFARGSRDLYAPEASLPNPPPQHLWSYCVSQEHSNTVYFHNSHTGRSVWVLPRLTSDSEEASNCGEETMRAIGSVDSAASVRKRDAFQVVHKAVSEEGVGGRSATAQPGARDAMKKVPIEERGGEKESGRQIAEIATGATTSSARARVTISKIKSMSPRGGERSGMTPVHERLAQWRMKRTQQQLGKSSGRLSSSSIASRDLSSPEVAMGSHTSHGIPPLYGQGITMTTNPTDGADARGTTTRDEEEEEEAGGLNRGAGGVSSLDGLVTGTSQYQYQQQQQQQLAHLEGDPHGERRRLLLEASEELQRDKVLALQRERLTLERVSRMKEVQLREEEERTRLATERRALEQRQLELQKQVLVRQRQFLAKAEEDILKREAATQLDAFFLKRQELEGRVEEDERQAMSFEVAIAKSLLDMAADGSHGGAKERRIDLRLLEDSDEEDTARNQESSTNAPCHDTRHREQKQQQGHQQQTARIAYSPSLMYVGDVVRGGRQPSSLFSQRQGHGTYFYDAAQKSFFEGEWADDKKNGIGALSLPHIALEGTWRNDQLEGRVMFQTQRLKGTGEFVNGVLDGSAVVELDCNSVFAGKVRVTKKNRSLACLGAITLASGDHVEWIPNAEGDDREKPQQLNRSGHATGRCRIRFSNGDVYIGHLEDYKPHENGSYHFAEGHTYTGEFCHGFLHGRGIYRFANGNVYVGQLHKGLFHGEGQYVQQGAYIYEGSWEYGTTHGKGKMIFANGDVWEGEFHHDRRVAGRYTASRLFQL